MKITVKRRFLYQVFASTRRREVDRYLCTVEVGGRENEGDREIAEKVLERFHDVDRIILVSLVELDLHLQGRAYPHGAVRGAFFERGKTGGIGEQLKLAEINALRGTPIIPPA